MSPDDAFLADIIENPDNDFPRLVYADWLEEQGDPRGEFIHAQCQLARMDEHDPQRPHLEIRERDLLVRHQALDGSAADANALARGAVYQEVAELGWSIARGA